MANLTIQIDSTDRTNRVQLGSLKIADNINQRKNICNLVVKKTPDQSFAPELNQEVIVLSDTERIFRGIITEIKTRVESVNHLVFDVQCSDFSHLLDRKLVLERFRSRTVEYIIDFILDKYDDEGFTMTNVIGDITIKSISFNRLKLSECLEKLAEVTGYSWYVDYNKDIHFFPKNQEPAPYNLTDTSENYIWSSLEINKDFTQLRNAIFVEGGEEQGNERSEEFTASGDKEERTYYRLANKFAETPDVTVNSVTQTVGVEFLNDDGDFDCMWDFNQKYIRFTEGNIPSVDDVVEVSGIPLFPIIVKVQSNVSINNFGYYEFVIRDKSIQSRDEAKSRAQAELSAYQNGLVEGSFRTYDKGLRSGQVISINSTIRDVSESFLIQKVNFKMRTPSDVEEGEWTVELATLRSIGIIDFLQNLLKDKGISEGESETLLTFLQFDDEVEATDDLTLPSETTSPPYMWMSDDPGDDATTIANNPTKTPIKWNFWTWSA